MAYIRALVVLLAFVLVSCLSGCGGGTLAGTTNPASPSTPSTPAAAPPVITTISPTSVPAGSSAFSLQISGSGFVNGSVIWWNSTALTTTFVSATVLKAAVPAALAASGGSFPITVANPDGQKSGSSNNQVVVNNPVPTITSLSPASITAGASATSVTVMGTGFLAASVASFGGKARATTVESATELTMALTATDLAVPGQVQVTVANPAPGGGTSGPSLFTVNPPPPVITGVTPGSLLVQSPDTPVTIVGTGFTPGSTVLVSGDMLIPTSITATAINVIIPAYELGSAAPLDLLVNTLNGFSNVYSLPVLNPVPAIQSISTTTVIAGSPGFSLQLQATGLVSTTQVSLNGVSLGQSGNPTSVPIPASVLAQVGAVSVSLTNPAPGGGTSNIATVHVIAGTNYLRSVNLPANALLWNPSQQVIYAAIAASATTNASNIVAIDPLSGNVVASQAMPGEPTLLAISGDQQYLYVGMTATAAIARLKLPALTPDIQWTVGPVPSANYAVSIYSMQVAPGLPHTLAVAQAAGLPGATELAIYDDGVMRPNTAVGVIQPSGYLDILQWGADASTIYGGEETESGGPEFIFSISPQGATLTTTNNGALNVVGPSLVYDSREGRLYDGAGEVVDPATGRLLGSFPAGANAFAIDSTQRRAYCLGGTPYGDSLNGVYAGSGAQITVYDQDLLTSEGTIVLPQVNGVGTSPLFDAEYLIRWGTAGLAFNTASTIYLLDGPFVTPGAPPSSSTGTFATPVPQLSGISPESVVAGSPDVTITLTGQNFTAATAVNWLGNNLASTLVSNTEVQAVIPSAALTAPTEAPLYIQNGPGEGISNVLAFSVLPQPPAGMQLTELNMAARDLVWNASNNLLYVAVAKTDSLRPQSIATVDPAAGTLLSVLPLSADPYELAISGDEQYLYAGFANYANVQRYALPGLSPDLLIPLGFGDTPVPGAINPVPGSATSCDFAVSVEVAPGLNSTIAVTQGYPGSSAEGCGATAVIDGATPRPVTPPTYAASGYDFSKLAWGADPTVLYAQGTDDSSFQPIYSLAVSNTGVAFQQSSDTDIYLGWRPHFDAGTGLIYSDGGAVTQPAPLTQVGNFQASGLMVPDSSLGLAYFLGQTADQAGIDYTLQVFDLKTYALLNSIVISNVVGVPFQMIRWGASGIAFTTFSKDLPGQNAPGLTYILSGPQISSPTASMKRKSMDAERVHFTWASRLRQSTANVPGGRSN
jgi:hypothetical protein